MAGFCSRARVLGSALALAVVLAACGSAQTRSEPVGALAPVSTTAAVTTTDSPTTTMPVAAEPAATMPQAATADDAPPTTEHSPSALAAAAGSQQAVVVSAAGYGATTATLTAWQRGDGGEWHRIHGPWTANVGRGGFAPPGQKREGDGRTPSGVYGFELAFGVEPDPGVALPYRRVAGPSIVWVDDPSSPSYNLWVDTATSDPGGHGEVLYQPHAYDYAAVIAYNAARTPGLGSAIFLHVSTGAPTSGCVSLPEDHLVDLLRWLDPARAPAIVMGVA